jgi:polyisoprenoid-binding protein YceI
MRYAHIYTLFMILFFYASCGGQNQTNPPKDNIKSETSARPVSLHVGDKKYVIIDTKESVVTWKGSNSFGAHTGYIYISKGELMIENGKLMGGTVEVDMNTIEDEEHGRNSGLINHLKDPDFFDVKKFPIATIAITRVASINVEAKQITGNLTIKGITYPVTFPAKMEVKDGIVKANGKLVIDRTKWGIRYKSGKFYDLLADKTISDYIEFNIKIVTKK